MLPYLGGEFGNPSSIHAPGRRARAAIDDSRDALAGLLGVKAHEIIFTGGGTESCNLGIIGLARAHAARGRHLITSAIEHHAVLHAFEYLAASEGFDLTVLPVDPEGRVATDALRAAIRPDTILVSVMHANNETGTVQPIAELAALCRSQGVLFHTDAVQTFGKLAFRPRELGVSAFSVAAHKFHGPKGAGFLWLEAGLPLTPLAFGGSHENTRRPGTENTAAIVGMTTAALHGNEAIFVKYASLAMLREALWQRIHEICPAAIRNTPESETLPSTLNVSFPGADGEALLIGLDLEGICVSSGSACMVGAIQPSHVLLAMGVAPLTALATVRFSLGLSTTGEEIRQTTDALRRVLRLQSFPVT